MTPTTFKELKQVELMIPEVIKEYNSLRQKIMYLHKRRKVLRIELDYINGSKDEQTQARRA